MQGTVTPDPSAEHKLTRIRQAVLDLGRLAWAASTPQAWPSEVYSFLGRAGAILGISDEEYQR